MKIGYLICIIMVLFIIGCVIEEVGEEEIPEEEPVSEPQENIVIEVPEEIEAPEEKPEAVENVIEIKEDRFYPEDITIYKGDSIRWVSDGKLRRIACYEGAYRIFFGERLTEKGQKSEFTFEEPGEYLCIDAIYGLRGTVKVKTFSRPAEVTAAVVGVMSETQFLPLMIIVGLITLMIIYSKKKEFF